MPMSKYIHFTEEQKERAANVNLEEYLLRHGEKLLASGREKRLESDHSITVRGCEWYDHAAERGGRAVSFMQEHYGMSYTEAVSILLNDSGEIPIPRERPPDAVKPFALPKANKDMHRVFAYLVKHRHIDRELVSFFAKAHLIYEDAEYHNAVFVGWDANGVPCHAHKRSTNSSGKTFRINVEGSNPRFSFHHTGTDGSLYVFEAPIDMLSYITLNPKDWQAHSYVACCGTSSQPVQEFIEQHDVNTVYLCLDNDSAGNASSKRMAELLKEKDIYSERLTPALKDWNDDLCSIYEQETEVQIKCPAYGL